MGGLEPPIQGYRQSAVNLLWMAGS